MYYFNYVIQPFEIMTSGGVGILYDSITAVMVSVLDDLRFWKIVTTKATTTTTRVLHIQGKARKGKLQHNLYALCEDGDTLWLQPYHQDTLSQHLAGGICRTNGHTFKYTNNCPNCITHTTICSK